MNMVESATNLASDNATNMEKSLFPKWKDKGQAVHAGKQTHTVELNICKLERCITRKTSQGSARLSLVNERKQDSRGPRDWSEGGKANGQLWLRLDGRQHPLLYLINNTKLGNGAISGD